MHGGGSGEFWGGANSGIYAGFNSETMEAKDFGDLEQVTAKKKITGFITSI